MFSEWSDEEPDHRGKSLVMNTVSLVSMPQKKSWLFPTDKKVISRDSNIDVGYHQLHPEISWETKGEFSRK